MQLQQFDSIQEFWHDTQAYLLQHEAENNLLLGILHILLHNPDRYPQPPYLAIAKTNDDILAVAIRTPPHKLLLSKAQNLDALTLIAQDLQQERLPGVTGLVPEVEFFVQIWQTLTGQIAQRTVAMRIHQLTIHQLTSVQPLSTDNGFLRLATDSDRSLLMKWVPAFNAEIAQVMQDSAEKIVDSGLQHQHIYLWEDGMPVSLASGKCSHGFARIGLVYTPSEYRQKGYATACVSALSQKFLDQGSRCCFLLTDVANPTSNHIYCKIGYQPMSDWHEYSLVSNDLEKS
jgi:uncharacterized protein